MTWFYAEGGQQIGPVSEDEFRSLRAEGRIRPDTLVWREGMAQWEPFNTITLGNGIDSSSGGPPPIGQGVIGSSEGGAYAANSFCTQCGRQVPATELVSYGAARICGNCKDSFFQRVREQGIAALPGTRRYGGFWIRFAARLIDGLLIWLIFLPIGLIAAAIGVPFFSSVNRRGGFDPSDPTAGAAFGGVIVLLYLFALVLVLVFEGWFVANRGGSPGKLALGLRIIRPAGERVTFWRAVCRYLAQILSGMLLYIGYIIAAFDSEKRALHDHICDTRVVYK